LTGSYLKNALPFALLSHRLRRIDYLVFEMASCHRSIIIVVAFAGSNKCAAHRSRHF